MHRPSRHGASGRDQRLGRDLASEDPLLNRLLRAQTAEEVYFDTLDVEESEEFSA